MIKGSVDITFPYSIFYININKIIIIKIYYLSSGKIYMLSDLVFIDLLLQ